MEKNMVKNIISMANWEYFKGERNGKGKEYNDDDKL